MGTHHYNIDITANMDDEILHTLLIYTCFLQNHNGYITRRRKVPDKNHWSTTTRQQRNQTEYTMDLQAVKSKSGYILYRLHASWNEFDLMIHVL
jgi:predicted acetyltransferase